MWSGDADGVSRKSETTSIPIVMANVGDPRVQVKLPVFARPGGNVTGLSTLTPGLNTKGLEILKDALPKLTRVGFLRTQQANLQPKELRAAAQALKLKPEEIETQADAAGFRAPFKPQSRSTWARS